MLINFYGLYDNFDLEMLYVIFVLVRKFYEVKVLNKFEVEVWGIGKVLREFLYVDDLVDVCVFLMNYYDGDMWINVGSGEEVLIEELVNIIKEVIGYEGKIVFNLKMLDGILRKFLDCFRLKEFGWLLKINFREGFRMIYDWYLKMYCR